MNINYRNVVTTMAKEDTSKPSDSASSESTIVRRSVHDLVNDLRQEKRSRKIAICEATHREISGGLREEDIHTVRINF
jgi:hypothetical protein